MKEADWKECVTANSALKISPDKAKAVSLRDTAVGRLAFLSKSQKDNDTINYIFEGYYSSVLEIVHAQVLEEGYSVRNHVCLGFYIRDVLKNSRLFRLFDDCRKKRNSLVYYGRKMDFETGKLAIKKCRELIKELK